LATGPVGLWEPEMSSESISDPVNCNPPFGVTYSIFLGGLRLTHLCCHKIEAKVTVTAHGLVGLG